MRTSREHAESGLPYAASPPPGAVDPFGLGQMCRKPLVTAVNGICFTIGIEMMLAGDVETGKLILRDYIKATVGFEELSAKTGTSAKSLIRMFGTQGNPQARNFFAVLSRLQERA